VKARRVKGLKPAGALADNAQRIVLVRLDELRSFIPKALEPGQVEALHDMRIAAKRLRYVLEVTAEPCFGPYAASAVKRARELQDLLGEIHDCDVQLPRVRALVDELREADAAEARARAGDAEDLIPRHASGTAHATAYRGLEALSIHLIARRRLLFDRFVELWTRLEREGFAGRLQHALGERPEPAPAVTPPSQNGNGAVPAEARPSVPAP